MSADPLGIACPTCKARENEPCRRPSGTAADWVHKRRENRAAIWTSYSTIPMKPIREDSHEAG